VQIAHLRTLWSVALCDMILPDNGVCAVAIKTIREDQIHLRIAGTLRKELEDEAAAQSRGLSGLIRKILVDHASRRIAERMENAA
jgi:hypothetical protein